MRATELLGATVVDSDGRDLTPVRDVLLTKSGGRFRVAGLVIGDGLLAETAHRTGYAAGRVTAPWPFRLLARSAIARARFVPAEEVASWQGGAIRLRVRGDDLPRLAEAVEG